jgi:anaerobic selenocysteine-containing dehydrogenase
MRGSTPSRSRNSLSKSAKAGESERIANGDRVKVSSKRGFIRAVAVVTRRCKRSTLTASRWKPSDPAALGL